MSSTSPEPVAAPLPNHLVWPSLLAALVTVAGSLYLSMGMGLKACPLCFYQRAFAMGIAAVLVMGVLSGDRYRGILNLLVLPLAAAGFAVAAFHVYLEAVGRLECPKGIYGYGSAPQQSLAAYVILLPVILLGVARSPGGGPARSMVVPTGVVLGIVLAWASVSSSPPPVVPTKPYDGPLDTCRVPFRP